MSKEEEVFIFPASFAQQRLWFIDRLVPGNAFYNVYTTIRLIGKLNRGALEQTFNEIVRRHEVLRTTFKIVDEQLVQVIAPTLSIPLPVVDLRELPAAEREAEALRLVTAEIESAFDLSTGALLRVMLVKLEETKQILVLNMHHIVADDWSMGVLMREIKVIYTSLVQGQPVSLPELPLQYADFADWQREWLQGEVLETQLAYWRQQLNGISVLNLPTDRGKPDIQTYKGATQFVELPKQLASGLQTQSKRSGVTLFMTLFAAFQTLLYRYTHQSDIAIGVAIANRNRSELESLIGFFVNTLVLRTDLSGNPTFLELLNRVREVTLGAYAHQDLPFEKLVEEISPERSLSRHPLFQVVFGFQNTPTSALELPGLVPKSLNIDSKTTRFDLELHLWECEEGVRSLWGGEQWKYSEGIRGVVAYSTDLFDKATITRMLGHFQTLLEGIVANPEQRLGELPILTEAERHQLLVEFNQCFQAEPGDNSFPGRAWERGGRRGGQCIHEIFEAQVEREPDARAVVFGNKQLTYRELNIRSNQLAHYLQKLGVGEEVIVGLCVEPSVDMIVGMLGILKAGGAYLPLDPTYPPERLSFMLADAAAPVLLTQEKLAEIVTFDHHSDNIIVCLDTDWEAMPAAGYAYAQQSEENPNTSLTHDNLAYIIYTSGSTGKPKGVAVPHKAVTRLVCNTNYVQCNPSDKIAQASNTSFDAATFEIWVALLNGAQLVGISRDVTLSPHELALQIRQQGISVLFLTTALFQQIAREVPGAFAELRYLLFGGEAVSSRWVQKILKNKPPKQLLHVYGPTEGTTFSTCYWVQSVPESATTIPIGSPISNTEIYLLDEQLQPVPIGVTGELYIGGDKLARGYLNRPELTAERFIPHPFSDREGASLYKTGDLARYLADGNIEFIGRRDEQVKIRGFRIELGEIEAVLSQHPAVARAVVIIWEEVPGDKQLVAYVVPIEHCQAEPGQEHSQAEPGNEYDEYGWRQFLKQKLPGYMVPSAYVVLESLPLTPNGKVDRRLLPEPDTFSRDIQEDYIAPRNSVEEVLVGIWAKVLGVEQVSVCDNFFELGGHSLLATQLISRIRDAFQVELTVRNLFEAPTVAGLARYIETIGWAAQGADTTRSANDKREEVEF